MPFKVGDKIISKSFGIGEILGIESNADYGQTQEFYIIRNFSTNARFKVAIKLGTEMRSLVSEDEVKKIIKILKSDGVVSHTTWNRRFRQFNDKLNTGSLADVAEVMRDLCTLKSDKELSFGEKKMLEKAKKLLVSEISAATSKTIGEIENEIGQIFLPN